MFLKSIVRRELIVNGIAILEFFLVLPTTAYHWLLLKHFFALPAAGAAAQTVAAGSAARTVAAGSAARTVAAGSAAVYCRYFCSDFDYFVFVVFSNIPN